MKSLSTLVAELLTRRETRTNLATLGKYLLVLTGVVAVYMGLFLLIMRFEGERHTVWTALYWTLTTMTTLGYGDVTFETDLGRIYSIWVLLSGVVMLLIVLPFVFIRYFYAPWLEAQVRSRAPRKVPADVKGHVIVCRYDTVCHGLLQKLGDADIPHYVIETDPVVAGRLWTDGVPVVAGEPDAVQTFQDLRVDQARAVVANLEDPQNTNVTLTVREASQDVPVLVTAEHRESTDLMELAGATRVLPIKQRLGEQLANRVTAKRAEAHVVGRFEDLLIAEVPVHGTPLVGRSIRGCELRERVGVNVVGVWERGQLAPVHPDVVFGERSVPVVVGTQEQLDALNEWIGVRAWDDSPVLVLGGGKVGRVVSEKLRERDTKVHLVERDASLRHKVEACADRVFIGEAADREVLMDAGIEEVPTVVLTTNDDATNIYLCIYCRKLSPATRIVSRITHGRNVEAIHRAGADFVLSYASIGEESVLSALQGRPFVMLGEGVDFFATAVPRSLEGKTLAESNLGARTGLNVIGIQRGDETLHCPPGSTRLEPGCKLLTLGTEQQRRALARMS